MQPRSPPRARATLRLARRFEKKEKKKKNGIEKLEDVGKGGRKLNANWADVGAPQICPSGY